MARCYAPSPQWLCHKAFSVLDFRFYLLPTDLQAAKDDPQQRKPDITRAKQLLNWEPIIDLDTGIRKTVEYFKEEIGLLKRSEKHHANAHSKD